MKSTDTIGRCGRANTHVPPPHAHIPVCGAEPFRASEASDCVRKSHPSKARVPVSMVISAHQLGLAATQLSLLALFAKGGGGFSLFSIFLIRQKE